MVPARYSESVGEVLSEIGEVVAVESVVRHLELGYMGRVDCIARYKWASCTSHHSTSQHITSHHITSDHTIIRYITAKYITEHYCGHKLTVTYYIYI